MSRLLATVLLAGLVVAPVRAQVTDSLVWELVGDTVFDVQGLAVTDTATFAVGFDGVWRLRPGDEDWTLVTNFPPRPSTDLAPYGPDTLFGFTSIGSLRVSTDGGQSWPETVEDDAETLPFEVPEGPHAGRLVVGEESGVAYSDDGGRTWAFVRMRDEVGFPLVPRSLVWLRPQAAFPEGRLVGVGIGGAAYSDDGGASWALSDAAGDFGYFAAERGAAVVVPGPGPPAADTVVAVLNRLSGPAGSVHATTDGAHWTLRGHQPGAGEGGARLVRTADGVLWSPDPLPQPVGVSSVWASRDGGRTWAATGPVSTERPLYLTELVIGPDRALWVGSDKGSHNSGRIGGVYRVVRHVVAAAAGEGAEAGGPALGPPYPNPTTGALAVPLALPAAAVVRAVAFDTLGRRVAVLHDGPLAGGAHTLALDTADLAAGTYVVRAEIGEGSTRSVLRHPFAVVANARR